MALPRINPEDYKPDKLLAAQLLVNKDSNDMTDSEIARECNIDLRTLYRWKNDPEFVSLMTYYAELAQDAFVPELYSSLRRAVRQGSTRAMELVLKNRGKLIEKREVQGNLGLTLEQSESLTHDVLLAEIAELKKKVGKLEAPKERLQLPEVIDAEVVKIAKAGD